MQIHDSFSNLSRGLRKHYDLRFKEPLYTSHDRFVWDYWHVPNQYTLHRTFAREFFPKKLLEPFLNELRAFGRQHLGCMDISEPWLSYYVEGSQQHLHCDNPHGPWAYVFSLSLHHGKKFQGGETLLMEPKYLNYWSEFSSTQGLEQEQLFRKIAPKFNRLTIFDPRIPHGVSEVTGTRDPRFARLVIHGWFTQPQPILEGAWTSKQADKGLHNFANLARDHFKSSSSISGTLCIKFGVLSNGTTQKPHLLTNTLISRVADKNSVVEFTKNILNCVAQTTFPKSEGKRTMILPLIFE